MISSKQLRNNKNKQFFVEFENLIDVNNNNDENEKNQFVFKNIEISFFIE